MNERRRGIIVFFLWWLMDKMATPSEQGLGSSDNMVMLGDNVVALSAESPYFMLSILTWSDCQWQKTLCACNK